MEYASKKQLEKMAQKMDKLSAQMAEAANNIAILSSELERLKRLAGSKTATRTCKTKL